MHQHSVTRDLPIQSSTFNSALLCVDNAWYLFHGKTPFLLQGNCRFLIFSTYFIYLLFNYFFKHQVEQLSETTGEESIILTASVSDGTLSHLGSESGKSFLDGHDEIKSQFLGFVLKSKSYSTADKNIFWEVNRWFNGRKFRFMATCQRSRIMDFETTEPMIYLPK